MSLSLILDAYFLESDEEAGGEGDDATRGEEEKLNCTIEVHDGDQLIPSESTLLPLQDEETDLTNVTYEPTQINGDSKSNTLPAPDMPSLQGNGIEAKIGDCTRGQSSNSTNDQMIKSEEVCSDRMPVTGSLAGSEVKIESSQFSSFVQKEEPLKCPYCLGIYYGTDELIQHLETHFQGKKPEEEGIVNVMGTNSVDQSRGTIHNRSNKFNCSKCDSTFASRRDLQKHMVLHMKTGRPWKCTKCSCRFTILSHLRRHENRLHGRMGVVDIRNSTHLCHRPRPNKKKLQRLKKGKGETQSFKSHKCDLCNVLFYRHSALTKHKRNLHTERVDRPWKCSECSSFFSTNQHLQMHENRRHGRKELKCIVCNVTLSCNSKVKNHMKTHDEIGRPWKCELCRSFFLSKNQLRHHENLRHGRKEYKCPVCNKIFIWESELESHTKLHKETGRPWTCSRCNYFFVSLASLQSHENRVHGKVVTRPISHKCLICRTTHIFSSQAKLRRHMGVHKEGADKPWKCSKCPSFFRALNPLRIHENLVHGRKAGRTKVKKVSCKICGGLWSPWELAKHLLTHSGDRPSFKCLICNRKFSHRRNAVRHLVTVHGHNRLTALSKVLHSSNNSKEEASPRWKDLLPKLRPCQLVLTRCDDLIPTYCKSNIKTEVGANYEDPEVSGKSTRIKVEWVGGEDEKEKDTREMDLGSENDLSTNVSASDQSQVKVVTFLDKTEEDNVKRKQIYGCPFCLKSFMESGLLIAHLPIHAVEHATENCKTEENQENLPTIHDGAESRDEASPKNPIKPSLFSGKHSKSYKCDHCNYSCLANQSLQFHMKQHSEKGRPFKCSKCNYTFTTFKSLRIHEGRFHKGSKFLHAAPIHKCQHCTYSSKALQHLRQHMELHKEDGRPFKCVICNFTFTTFKSLRIHEGRFHKGSKSLQIAAAPTPIHKCQHCNYSSAILQRLMFHLEHHKEEGRPFKCIRCSFTFTTFKSLRMHEGRLHKGSKSFQIAEPSTVYKCHCCKYSTRILRAWQNHMASHKKARRKPFKCSLCGSFFHNFKELRIHTRRLHMNQKLQLQLQG